MARPRSKYPTELELEILKVLWGEGPLMGREVRDSLAVGSRDLAYTSVMTVMGIMVDKGYLRRKKRGNGYIYSARVTEKATTLRMLQDLVKRAYDGSMLAAMVHLLESGDTDEDEIKELRQLLKHKSEEKSE